MKIKKRNIAVVFCAAMFAGLKALAFFMGFPVMNQDDKATPSIVADVDEKTSFNTQGCSLCNSGPCDGSCDSSKREKSFSV